jgi:hypothetical protein
MTSFSDDDLKWLKEYLERPPKNQTERISKKNPTRLRENFFRALLSRLDAAEQFIIDGFGSDKPPSHVLYEAWRKACGK